ncbi:glycosyltransferase [uncultured Sunxiuqinia sp.]|uniref:glycosyltransferase n=1 Tax=uncultured Sunxiuqinia sp. TaxID=1573825 RepID=UPI002AA6384E|nr:glycosyltransferase [uncultured Sunxiuqinia sp.]
MKKISHIVSSIDISNGGPSKSVSDLALYQAIQGQKVTILTTKSQNPYFSKSPNLNLQLSFVENGTFRKALNLFLKKEQFDILHGHGIWQLPVHYMSQLAQKKGIPYIITPRGMLEPWALDAGKWKKRLAMALYQRKDLAQAACIHATAQMEADHIRELGFSNPIAVIPNGIDVSDFPLRDEKTQIEKQTLLFLSRIHPKKGIELLIEAWQQLTPSMRKNWQVKIAGNGDESYISTLNRLIQKRGLNQEIKIIGPQFGNDKLAAYHSADLFVLPTYSENFGIVVAEAMACGIPVITTKGTPWEELNTHNAGWWIDIGAKPLVACLKRVLKLSEQEKQEMGRRGRKLIEEKYSIQAVASQMIQLYEWILGQKEKPDFVI